MRRSTVASLVVVLTLLAAACATESAPLTTVGPSEEDREAASSPTTSSIPELPDVGPTRTEYEDFDHSNFTTPAVIDNQWLPLLPGTRLTFVGSTSEEGELIEHEVVSIVTDLTKVIDGIESLVIWDLDFSDGELAETELAFFAQDDDGNVWRMGEHPEEYDSGALVDAPTWLAGLAGARAGIALPADPASMAVSYSQGWGPAVEFIDRAIVSELDQSDCVEAGCFDGVLIVDEFNVEEPGAFQHKYFAPGVGNIRVHWSGSDETHEELELTEIETLSAVEMDEVRSAALALEAHAYEVSPDLYGLTDPIAGDFQAAAPLPQPTDEAEPTDEGEPTSEGEPAMFTARSFDPFGNDGEHDEQVGRIVDGLLDTAWQTETYETPIGDLKPGVGLVIETDATPEAVDVSGVTDGTVWELRWAAASSDSLDDWAVVATGTVSNGSILAELGTREGGAWLLWFTDLPDTGEGTYRTTVAEVRFLP